MKSVLIDTSVWVDHFRQGNDVLMNLLVVDAALMHPMVLGELACGTPPIRQTTLGDLALLPQTQQASLEEVVAFVEREKLYGLGCGIVDMILLASTLITPGIALWTVDKRLSLLAERFSVLYNPYSH
jgi:hypothetical protein